MKFLISVFLFISLYAKVIDKIEIIVNNIPITSYEILKLEKTSQINRDKAISILIDKAILHAEIKKRGIYVDDFDIDEEMQKIAQKNGMSLFNFKDYLLQKGELMSLKTQIKSKIQRDKLLKSMNIRVTREDVKKYYETHKNQFLLPSKVDTTQYVSNNKQSLIEVIKNPLLNNPDIKIKNMSFSIDKTNPRLLEFLSKTKEGSFTPIINIQNQLVTFYIVKKYPLKALPYQMLEMNIYNKLIQQKNAQALQDLIVKLRAKANIEFLTKKQKD